MTNIPQLITSDNTGTTALVAVSGEGSAWQHCVVLTQTFAFQVGTAALVMPHSLISPPPALIHIDPYI